jgi:putative ABC transport system permease protein
LKAELDRYNEQSGLPENHQIVYSDVMSDFTESLGVLIKVVSVVLIIFAAISLVVSSIMMGIITYVSVIERTKEIGVYRAVGARKIDVGRLSESECSIIGAAAGLLGVVLTWIMTFPLNAILSHHYPDYNLEHLARVSPWHALILIALGIFLAFISGLFPARVGANKNPVDALRSE